MWRLEKIDKNTWEKYWKKVDCTNMLQSWQYGEAKQVTFLRHCNYLILDDTGLPQGLVQILVRTIWGLGGIARINRGPLFFYNDELGIDMNKVEETFGAIRNEAIQNNWWYMRVAPELHDDNDWEKVLINNGMRKISHAVPYGSLLLSLDKSEDDLFKHLKGKWRNLLRKSMSFGMRVIRMSSTSDIDYLLKKYNEYQEIKSFTGLPENLVRKLAQQGDTEDWTFQILGAYTDGSVSEPVAVLVSVCHGDTCTYLIGMSSDEGRRLNANYLLLWNAILNAKSSGCRYFDLGGLTDDTTKGVAHFKSGTGGDSYKLVGEWDCFNGIAERIYNLISNSKSRTSS